MRILVDLDDVLADFVGSALRIHGRTPVELAGMPPQSWSIVQPLGLTEQTFWRPIDIAGEDFWADLPLLPHGLELVECVEQFNPEWYLVTAPSQHPSSLAGKCRWIKKVFGNSFDRFVFTQHKHLLANSETVLIDDRAQSVSRFIQCGGRGIIFPTPYNKEPYQDCTFYKTPYQNSQVNYVGTKLAWISQSIKIRKEYLGCRSSRCSCNS